MQSVLDRVVSTLTLRHPMSESQSQAVRDDAVQFAAQLLENYKTQLSQRPNPEQVARTR